MVKQKTVCLFMYMIFNQDAGEKSKKKKVLAISLTIRVGVVGVPWLPTHFLNLFKILLLKKTIRQEPALEDQKCPNKSTFADSSDV